MQPEPVLGLRTKRVRCLCALPTLTPKRNKCANRFYMAELLDHTLARRAAAPLSAARRLRAARRAPGSSSRLVLESECGCGGIPGMKLRKPDPGTSARARERHGAANLCQAALIYMS